MENLLMNSPKFLEMRVHSGENRKAELTEIKVVTGIRLRVFACSSMANAQAASLLPPRAGETLTNLIYMITLYEIKSKLQNLSLFFFHMS